MDQCRADEKTNLRKVESRSVLTVKSGWKIRKKISFEISSISWERRTKTNTTTGEKVMDRAVFKIGTIWTKLTKFEQRGWHIYELQWPKLVVIILFVIHIKFCTHMILNRLKNCNLISKFEYTAFYACHRLQRKRKSKHFSRHLWLHLSLSRLSFFSARPVLDFLSASKKKYEGSFSVVEAVEEEILRDVDSQCMIYRQFVHWVFEASLPLISRGKVQRVKIRSL